MQARKSSLLAEVWTIFTIMVFIYGAFVSGLYVSQRFFMYFPDKSVPTKPEGARLIHVVTDDTRVLKGWYFKPKYKDTPVILFFHGNAGHIGHRYKKIKPFIDEGYGVLLAEYRGYGGNEGLISERGFHMDALAYYKWLRDKKIHNIIAYGESLGAGVAVHLAKDNPVMALILETPFASTADAAKRQLNVIPYLDFFMKDPYDSASKIASIPVPKLFLIAGRDEVLGAQTAVDLYHAAHQPKQVKLYESGTHNTLYQHGAGADVMAFIKEVSENRVKSIEKHPKVQAEKKPAKMPWQASKNSN